jgi:hypothetical protein
MCAHAYVLPRYNTRFVEQVAAMEAKATELGMPKTLFYLFPDNSYLNATDLAKAEALGLGEHLVVDLHVGATGAPAAAAQFFTTTTSTASAINCEVNARIHTMHRALTEAIDMNDFFNFPATAVPAGSVGGEELLIDASAAKQTSGLLIGRMASFCMERSGQLCSNWVRVGSRSVCVSVSLCLSASVSRFLRSDPLLCIINAYRLWCGCPSYQDQGISFFSADQIWLQPPGWVHKMIHDSWQPLSATVTLKGQQEGGACTCPLRNSLLSCQSSCQTSERLLCVRKAP